MVMPINKFFRSIPGQEIDVSFIKSAAEKADAWLKDDDEGTRQKGRRVEGAVKRLNELSDEFEELSRVAKGALETPVTEFRIVFGTEQLQMDKTTGTQTCQFVIDLLASAMRINRLHFMESYISLLKNVR